MKLVPVGAISGRVLDADGQPVEMDCRLPRWPKGGPCLRSRGMTDDRGAVSNQQIDAQAGMACSRFVRLTVPMPPEKCARTAPRSCKYAAAWRIPGRSPGGERRGASSGRARGRW